MSPQLAYIGLGNIGRGMCANLVAKGNLDKALILYNRTTSRAEALAEKLGRSQTKVAAIVADAVRPADIIFICLSSDAASRQMMKQTILGDETIDVARKVFVEVSTLHPDTVNELGAAITAKGAEFVVSPGEEIANYMSPAHLPQTCRKGEIPLRAGPPS
jgi:3-hydroxyisobutyrate dehydrogenase-like beta-hydroxyacid dehydrogenase